MKEPQKFNPHIELEQLSLFMTAERQAKKVDVKGVTQGAVLAPTPYENSPAVAPPSPAGNEALKATSAKPMLESLKRIFVICKAYYRKSTNNP